MRRPSIVDVHGTTSAGDVMCTQVSGSRHVPRHTPGRCARRATRPGLRRPQRCRADQVRTSPPAREQRPPGWWCRSRRPRAADRCCPPSAPASRAWQGSTTGARQRSRQPTRSPPPVQRAATSSGWGVVHSVRVRISPPDDDAAQIGPGAWTTWPLNAVVTGPHHAATHHLRSTRRARYGERRTAQLATRMWGAVQARWVTRRQ
uniref:Uncharacterized protein n=1 Tax=Rhodococcus erythropolis TaxID=1833 RepID=Q6XMV6_RHOER|nr:hypothetical protein PBD2.190 [Rhodococcus erythropolis]